MAAVFEDEWDDPEILQALDQAESEGIRRLSHGDDSQYESKNQFRNKNEGKQPPKISQRNGSNGSDKSFLNDEFQNTFDKSDPIPLSHTSNMKKRPWEEEVEGEYLAALRGSNSQNWQGGNSKGQRKNSLSGRQTNGMPVDTLTKRHQSENTNFSHTSSYKSSERGGVGDFGDSGPPPDKNCRCGGGICRVLTASTEKNRGRQFYRCPLSQEEGQCPFFEWCDESSSLGSSDEQQLNCECGAGTCSVVTAKTEKNNGRKFFRCPLPRETSCSFFKWCDEVGQSPIKKNDNFSGGRTSFSGGYSLSGTGENGGGSGGLPGTCFSCGQDGHWSKDCPLKGSGSYGGGGGGGGGYGNTGDGGSRGSCYKCGSNDGHWSKDCPSKGSGGFGGYGGSGSNGGSGGYGSKSGGSFQGNYGSRGGPGGSNGNWKSSSDGGRGGWKNDRGGGGGQETGGRGGSCFNCKLPGHFSNACPN